MLSALVEPTSFHVKTVGSASVAGSDSGTVVQVWLLFVDPRTQQAEYSLTMVVDPDKTTITAVEPGSPPVTTTTIVLGVASPEELDWPNEWLQPETVMRMLHEELGTRIVPIYLPETLPDRFYTGPDFVIEKATGGYLPNPQVWNQVSAGGVPAGREPRGKTLGAAHEGALLRHPRTYSR